MMKTLVAVVFHLKVWNIFNEFKLARIHIKVYDDAYVIRIWI